MIQPFNCTGESKFKAHSKVRKHIMQNIVPFVSLFVQMQFQNEKNQQNTLPCKIGTFLAWLAEKIHTLLHLELINIVMKKLDFGEFSIFLRPKLYKNL